MTFHAGGLLLVHAAMAQGAQERVPQDDDRVSGERILALLYQIVLEDRHLKLE
jgi:hypothetical protein